MELIEKYFSRMEELKNTRMDPEEFIKKLYESGKDEELMVLIREMFGEDIPVIKHKELTLPKYKLYNLEDIKFTCGR